MIFKAGCLFELHPPYWMTRSGCSAGSVEGNVTNLKSDMFDDFADYLTEVVRYYHDSLGITFNYLEPFNEPDGGWWKAFGNQEGCFFSNNDQIVMIRELYAKLSEKNMLSYCRITANDANSIRCRTISNAGITKMQEILYQKLIWFRYTAIMVRKEMNFTTGLLLTAKNSGNRNPDRLVLEEPTNFKS
jgi:hypothetical protein